MKYRTTLDQLRLKYQLATSRLKEEKAQLKSTTSRLANIQEAQILCQQVATQVQNIAHKRIADIVSSCLQIFDDPYQFKILFKRSRGKTEAHLLFQRDGIDADPLSSTGGGVVDVAAFALRLATLVLRRPPLRRILVLDEPFRFVSKEYRSRVRKLLEDLSTTLNIQIIMVTHDPQLATGKVIDLGE